MFSKGNQSNKDNEGNEGNEAKGITRRTALGRGAGIAAIGAVSTFAATSVNPSPAAAASGTAPLGNASNSSTATLPTDVAGIRLPDSEVARAAAALARGVSSVTLFNHVMRTYLYGSLLFDRRGVRYDRELVFVGAVLHDLGLVEAYQTPDERFEVDGADAAQRFLREQRMPAERVAVVWDAIALHTSNGIATRKRPEIAMIAVGSSVDFAGEGVEQIPSDALADILTAFPRENFKQHALDDMVSLCRTKPMSVLMHPFAEVGRRHIPDFPVPTVEDLLFAAPFEE
ncbi:HD domain-containing protein [Streptomyces aurantiacus]|uniref:HD domain-containing protein n=1 Tax=Streptomyces aurantiacus TaxID=47760 RepID=A0A7G1NVV6_9ACTN|nr:HD domain-containing protein [Streptomyces aurantiacus]BCL26752.1 hypothetical protein GCM10017557_16110 [Streptomyces aurantiacus]